MLVHPAREADLLCDHEPLLQATTISHGRLRSLRGLLLVLIASSAAAAVFAPNATLLKSHFRINAATQLASEDRGAIEHDYAVRALNTMCPAPAQNFDLPHKGCPAENIASSCVANNREYTTFSQAWAVCGRVAECGVVMRWTSGGYYLRRRSDPDLPIEGARSMLYSCSHQGASEATMLADDVAGTGNAEAHETTAPAGAVARACSPPAERLLLPHKGCPAEDVTSCVANNRDYASFAEAWVACGTISECGSIMRWTDGKYHLRRRSDPDFAVEGAASMLFSCSELEAGEAIAHRQATLPADGLVVAGNSEVSETTAPTRVVAQACSPPSERLDLPQKGCPVENIFTSCVANNHEYATFAEAWAACGTTADCDLVMRWTSGGYYLRRRSDPDLAIAGAWSMLYSSCDQGAGKATAPADGLAGAHNSEASEATAPGGAVAQTCSPPAEIYDLPQKGCPAEDLTSCLAENQEYATFEEAWVACGTVSECGVVLRWTNGKHYLRRRSDPDFAVEGAASMLYSCGEMGLGDALTPADVPAEGGAEPAEADTTPLGFETVSCSPPAEKFDLPHKGCSTDDSMSSCLANNVPFATFAQAWAACGAIAECGVVMRRTSGEYHLRRRSDPDLFVAGASSMIFSCTGQVATTGDVALDI